MRKRHCDLSMIEGTMTSALKQMTEENPEFSESTDPSYIFSCVKECFEKNCIDTTASRRLLARMREKMKYGYAEMFRLVYASFLSGCGQAVI